MVVRLSPGKVTLYPGEPALFVVDPGGPVIRDLDRRMTRAQRFAVAHVGVNTGRLASTIRKQPRFRKTSVAVALVAGNRTRYLMAHHDGSKAHLITVKARKRKGRRALRFVVNGQVVFRRTVIHPGTKPTRFLTRSLSAAGD